MFNTGTFQLLLANAPGTRDKQKEPLYKKETLETELWNYKLQKAS